MEFSVGSISSDLASWTDNEEGQDIDNILAGGSQRRSGSLTRASYSWSREFDFHACLATTIRPDLLYN